MMTSSKTVDEVWNEIITGRGASNNNKPNKNKIRKKCKVEKEEVKEEEEMMTLEDFLVKAGAVDEEEVVIEEEEEEEDRKGNNNMGGIVKGYSFDSIQLSPFTSGEVGVSSLGKGKRRSTSTSSSLVMGLEPLDKAAQQRQRRMIKNRESAARSRERKQAYQVELESLAVKLEEENERLLKDKAEQTKERYKLLMEKIIPVVEQRRPPRALRRVHSLQW